MPVAIFNNTRGDHDARVLADFGEAAWNNPVVRVLDAGRKDLVPKLSDEWTVRALARRMVEALEAAKRPVPPYLRILDEEQGGGVAGRKPPADGAPEAIKNSPLRFVPLTPLQARRLARDRKADVLSPGQKALLAAVEAHPEAPWKSALDADIVAAWRDASKVRAALP